MNLLDLLANRRSIRSYTGEAIPQEMLTQVLQAGLLSETSRNRKPWEFVVIQNKETLDALSRCRAMGSAMLKQAACAILIYFYSIPKKFSKNIHSKFNIFFTKLIYISNNQFIINNNICMLIKITK